MTSFIQHVESTHLQVQECVLFVLFWIAASDDQLDEDEVLFMSSHFGFENLSSTKIEQMLSFIKYAVAEDFRFVIDVLRGLDKESKQGLITLAIGVAVADNKLAIAENHILRFLCDAMQMTSTEFTELYESLTGGKIPQPGDPSSKVWWEAKRQKSQSSNEESYQKKESDHNHKNHNQQREEPPKSNSNLSKLEAMKILGVEHGADNTEIKLAYRRLTKLHHPDKFHSLGDEAVQAANIIFRRIVEAYEVLSL